MLRQGHIILHIKNGTERVLRSLALRSTVLLCGMAALKRLDDDATSYSMTQKELNSVLTGWGYGPGTVLDLKLTLMAKPFNTQKFLMPETSTCTFVAVSY